MAGVTSIAVKASLDELVQQLPHVKTPRDKERLQVLYWLKQEKAPTSGALAQVIGNHRHTVGRWLLKYRDGGVKAILERKSLAGGVRKLPQGAAEALAKRLKAAEQGFNSLWAHLKADLKWASFKTLEQRQAKVDQLLTQLTLEVRASIPGYSFILDALSALNAV